MHYLQILVKVCSDNSNCIYNADLNTDAPDLHSGQMNFPFGASAREMQGRWKAPQH